MREQRDITVSTFTKGIVLSAIELECPFANTLHGQADVGFDRLATFRGKNTVSNALAVVYDQQ
jgi:hypothetical protein